MTDFSRAEWRLGRGWSDPELTERLAAFRLAEINFHFEGSRIPTGRDWHRYFTQAVIAKESPGSPEPGGPFERAWAAIERYQFSDPGIMVAHYDPREPLVGRTMLLELQVLGFRFLCGTRVTFDRHTQSNDKTVRGFRYDTLQGHLEAGSEWFLLTKNHQSGEIRFRIHASWRMAEFPNWWSKLGFRLLGERYQLAWHRLSYLRLRHFLGSDGLNLDPVPSGRDLVHAGAEAVDSDLWILRAAPPSVQVGALGKRAEKSLEKLENQGGKHAEAKRVERVGKGPHHRSDQWDPEHRGT